MPHRVAVTVIALALTACSGGPDDVNKASDAAGFRQAPDALLAGELMAVAYSGYREGQHPDLGQGAIFPDDEQILEDLDLLLDAGFDLIRLYSADEYNETVLRLIREHELPMKVLLGLWLRAEVSNHEGCAWLTEPIPDEELAANVGRNEAEVLRGLTRPPRALSCFRPSTRRSSRVASLTLPSLTGTLRSARMNTRLPFRSRSTSLITATISS